MKIKPELEIKEFKSKELKGYRAWTFLKYPEKQKNFNYRWVIAQKEDGWIGVVALFPHTHKKAIKDIAYEMVLARKAITLIEKRKVK